MIRVVNSCKCALYVWFVLQVKLLKLSLAVAGQRWSGGQSSRMIGWKVAQRSQTYTRRTSGTAFLVFMEDFAVLKAGNLYIFFPDLAHWTFCRTFVILVQDISLSSQVFSWATYSFAQISAAGWGPVERRSQKSLPNSDQGMKGNAPFLISQLNLLGAGVLPLSWTSRVGGRKRWWLSMEMATASKYFLGPKVGFLRDIFANEDEFFLTSQGEESMFRSRKVWIRI